MDNNNYHDFNTATPYYNSSMPTYGAPTPQKQSNGFGIASLVLGILSLTVCCLIGPLLGLIGIILGIVGLCKKNAGKGTSIAGIITSVLGIIVSIVLYVLMVQGTLAFIDYAEETVNEVIESMNPFYNHTFEARDGSTIYFQRDYSFIWYLSDDDHSDNYSSGTYEVYMAGAASEYLSIDLSEFGVTESEIDAYFDRNSDSEFYSEENLCVLVLRNEETIIDGVIAVEGDSAVTYYFGFYKDGIYDAVNMNTANYAYFTLVE